MLCMPLATCSCLAAAKHRPSTLSTQRSGGGMQGFPGDLLPVVSDPVVLLTEELQYPTVEFYDYEADAAIISQPSGRSLDARDERLRQVSYADGLLWTSAPYWLVQAEAQCSGGACIGWDTSLMP